MPSLPGDGGFKEWKTSSKNNINVSLYKFNIGEMAITSTPIFIGQRGICRHGRVLTRYYKWARKKAGIKISRPFHVSLSGMYSTLLITVLPRGPVLPLFEAKRDSNRGPSSKLSSPQHSPSIAHRFSQAGIGIQHPREIAWIP